MVEAREDLALVAEATQDRIGIHAALDELDGDDLFVLLVGPPGEKTTPIPPLPSRFETW